METNEQRPTEGGTYRRNTDGTLECIEPPTKPAKLLPQQPITPASPESAEE